MLIFANPLGAAEFDKASTLVNKESLSRSDERIGLVYHIRRQTATREWREFAAYRKIEDIPEDWMVKELIDPFPQPASRVGTTQARGKFRLPIRLYSKNR